MRKIILVSHSTLAEGMYGFLTMIVGKRDDISFYNAYVEGDTFEKDMDVLLEENSNDELVIVTDLFGGSVNNYLLSKNDKIHLVSGMNAGLLLDLAINLNSDSDIGDIIRKSIDEAKKGILYCNDIDFQQNEEDEF